MAENLQIALRLTVLGMGVTFTAIGVLVLGMYLMTWLLRERPGAADDVDESIPLFVREEEESRRRLAAAIAAAVAVANETQLASIRRLPYGVWGVESRVLPLLWRTQRRMQKRRF